MAIAGCRRLDVRCAGDSCYCKVRKNADGTWKTKPNGNSYSESYRRRTPSTREVRCLFPHEHRRECMCAVQGPPLLGRSTRTNRASAVRRINGGDRNLVRLRVIAVYDDGTACEMTPFKVTDDDLTGFEVDGEQHLAFIARVPRHQTEQPATQQPITLEESELPF